MPRLINSLEQIFSSDSISDGPSLLISYSSLTGNFAVGETIVGASSTAMAFVKSSIEPQITAKNVVGTFQVGETITGGTSGATATVDNFFLYDFPSGASPLANGQIDFFESGSSTVRKTTFSDVANTIPNPNPLIINGDGRVPNVYGIGTYRIVVRTSTGVQILQRDPIGGDDALSFGAPWVATQIYSEADVSLDDGRYWLSLISGNAGNQPSIDSGSNWAELPFQDISNNTAQIIDIQNKGITDWDVGTTYELAYWVRSPVDGEVYKSLIPSNLGSEPSVSPSSWARVDPDTIPADIVTYDNSTSGLSATDVQGAIDENASNNRKNLIINGLLSRPINQRSAANITDTASSYNFDRWYYDGSDLFYGVEENDLREGNFVLNWLSDATCEYQLISTGTGSGSLPAGGWTSISKNTVFNITGITGNNLWLKFIVGGDGFNALDEVQLEEGSSYTAFEYRHYATELMLCQRYYETYSTQNFPFTQQSDSTVMIPYKVTKRIPAGVSKIFISGTNDAGFSYSNINGFRSIKPVGGIEDFDWTADAEL